VETERLILRQFTADDLDALVELNSDPEVTFFINGGRPIPRDELASDYLPAYLTYHEKNANFGFFVAQEKASGEFIGWFHFRAPPEKPADEPELGYRLRRSAWGKGYGTEGSKALVDKGFRDLGVRVVTANTMVVNSRSRRVMEKVGMRQVRIFYGEWPEKIPGDEHGDVEYAITREEWEQARSPE